MKLERGLWEQLLTPKSVTPNFHHLVIGMIGFAACAASFILEQHKTRNAQWRNTEHQFIKLERWGQSELVLVQLVLYTPLDP